MPCSNAMAENGILPRNSMLTVIPSRLACPPWRQSERSEESLLRLGAALAMPPGASIRYVLQFSSRSIAEFSVSLCFGGSRDTGR